MIDTGFVTPNPDKPEPKGVSRKDAKRAKKTFKSIV